jgi:branched-chain amino acid transport system ATP-binding protein
VLENVSLAAFFGSSSHISREEADKRAAESLKLVGMPSAPGLPVEGLSVAGLKKLELARALATQPKILLADESLGGLDEAEMSQAAQMLRRIRDERELSIIWVEHIMRVLMGVVDRCLVLNHGEIIAGGTPHEVAHDPHVVEVYLGTDANDIQQQTHDRHLANQSGMTDVTP